MALKPRKLEVEESVVELKTTEGEKTIGTYLGERKCDDGNIYHVISYVEDVYYYYETLATRKGDTFYEIEESKRPLAYRKKNQESKSIRVGEYKLFCKSDDVYEIEAIDGKSAKLVDVWETREDEAGNIFDIVSCICGDLNEKGIYFVLKRLDGDTLEVIDLDNYADEETAKGLQQNIDALIVENDDEYTD